MVHVCFVAHTLEAMCDVGTTCVLGGACNITGFAVAMMRRLVAVAIPAAPEIFAMCVASLQEAPGQCDVVGGGLLQDQVYQSTRIPSVAYDADQMAIMRPTDTSVGPWAFLKPFSTWLWLSVAMLACVLTPLVSAVVEYDQGESFLSNFRTYLISSVHAFAGVDPLYHTGDTYSKESAFLSTIVAIVSRVVLNVYACNLVAYVIARYFDTGTVYDGKQFERVATWWSPSADFLAPIARSTIMASSSNQALEAYRNGTVDAIAAAHIYLTYKQQCGDAVNRVPGPKLFFVLAFSPTFPHSAAFNKGILFDMQTCQLPTMHDAHFRCPSTVSAIGLGSVYGLFSIFGIAIACITAVGVATHVVRWRRQSKLNYSFGGPVNGVHDSGATVQMQRLQVSIDTP